MTETLGGHDPGGVDGSESETRPLSARSALIILSICAPVAAVLLACHILGVPLP